MFCRAPELPYPLIGQASKKSGEPQLHGYIMIELPSWFTTANSDTRLQATIPNVYPVNIIKETPNKYLRGAGVVLTNPD
jgi:hypothetical protein